MWTFCPECHSRRDARVPYCEACGAKLAAEDRVAFLNRLKGYTTAAAIGLLAAAMQEALRRLV